ncbi:TetR family transcriptional regulator [Streptomyces sp. SID8352]|nr:TetR/AcrR family transcriptional regulator [Streptomyces sp. SID8352]MYU26179.1 TetR family transcriptional regulator [Streptomyces sp. SID8352]
MAAEGDGGGTAGGARCACCGTSFDHAARGRPRQYCSRACQARAYRARSAGYGEPDGRPGLPGSASGAPPDTESPLSVDRIVGAGIGIADAEGLDALSMRRVAEALGAATMSLYRHVPSKDELLARMVEAAQNEAPPPQTPADGWREGLRRAARRDWELYLRHPWILPQVMMSTRGRLGRGVAADSESALASFDGLGLEPAEAFRHMFTFASYVQGVALTLVASEASTGPGTSTGPPDDFSDFPRLARAMAAGARPWDLEARFTAGLETVLDGIAVALARGGGRSDP